jgi:hypothetical protein
MLKLNTARDMMPLTMAVQILLAVDASLRLSQGRFDFISWPAEEKSKVTIPNDRSKKRRAMIAGMNAMLLIVLI